MRLPKIRVNNNQAPLAAATRMEVRRRTFRYDGLTGFTSTRSFGHFERLTHLAARSIPMLPRLGRLGVTG